MVTTVRGERTRERILRAAAELFEARGVHATGLDDVLQHSEASKSQLYHHFGDKQGLVMAAIAARRCDVVAPIVASLAAVSTRAEYAAWLGDVASYHESRGFTGGCPVGALASELSDVDDEARVALAASFGEWRDALALALERLQDTGELAAGTDVDALARAQLSLLEGALLLMRTERDGITLRAAITACLALLGPA